jgi:hypothetical protein
MSKHATVCLLILVLWCTPTCAQNINDILNLFRGAVENSMRQAAQSQWQSLPESELTCLNQSLHRQGASIDALIARGIGPTDPRLAALRSTCRVQIANAPGQKRLVAIPVATKRDFLIGIPPLYVLPTIARSITRLSIDPVAIRSQAHVCRSDGTQGGMSVLMGQTPRPRLYRRYP